MEDVGLDHVRAIDHADERGEVGSGGLADGHAKVKGND
jgi:hypothetical protein